METARRILVGAVFDGLGGGGEGFDVLVEAAPDGGTLDGVFVVGVILFPFLFGGGEAADVGLQAGGGVAQFLAEVLIFQALGVGLGGLLGGFILAVLAGDFDELGLEFGEVFGGGGGVVFVTGALLVGIAGAAGGVVVAERSAVFDVGDEGIGAVGGDVRRGREDDAAVGTQEDAFGFVRMGVEDDDVGGLAIGGDFLGDDEGGPGLGGELGFDTFAFFIVEGGLDGGDDAPADLPGGVGGMVDRLCRGAVGGAGFGFVCGFRLGGRRGLLANGGRRGRRVFRSGGGRFGRFFNGLGGLGSVDRGRAEEGIPLFRGEGTEGDGAAGDEDDENKECAEGFHGVLVPIKDEGSGRDAAHIDVAGGLERFAGDEVEGVRGVPLGGADLGGESLAGDGAAAGIAHEDLGAGGHGRERLGVEFGALDAAAGGADVPGVGGVDGLADEVARVGALGKGLEGGAGGIGIAEDDLGTGNEALPVFDFVAGEGGAAGEDVGGGGGVVGVAGDVPSGLALLDDVGARAGVDLRRLGTGGPGEFVGEEFVAVFGVEHLGEVVVAHHQTAGLHIGVGEPTLLQTEEVAD